MEVKAGVNISRRRYEAGGAHWAMREGWPKAHSSMLPRRSRGSKFLPDGAFSSAQIVILKGFKVVLTQHLDTRLLAGRQDS